MFEQIRRIIVPKDERISREKRAINDRSRKRLGNTALKSNMGRRKWYENQFYEYTRLADAAYKQYIKNLAPKNRAILKNKNVMSGFLTIGTLLGHAPDAYTQYCTDSNQPPNFDEYIEALKNSVDAATQFARVPDDTNHALELHFGLKPNADINQRGKMEFSLTDTGLKYQPSAEAFNFIVDRYSEFEIENAALQNAKPGQCPGQTVIIETWPIMIDACTEFIWGPLQTDWAQNKPDILQI